jgi:4-hydroxy-2-oxoheptanedioate aldolase
MAILDDILALEGIDAVFVGPSDLSIALSGGKEVNPLSAEVDEAIRHIVARASSVGKPVAIYAQSAERAKAFLDMGAKLVTVMSDIAFLRAAAQTALTQLGR